VVDGPASADFRAIKIMFDLIWETRRVRRSRHLPRPPLSPKADENGHRTAQGAVLEGDA
jgi:hypothetical protein